MKIYKIDGGVLLDGDYTIPPFEILPLLNASVCLAENTTFRDLVNFFHSYPDLNYVFPELAELTKYRHTFHNNIDNADNILYIDQQHEMSWSSYSVTGMFPAEDQGDSGKKSVVMDFSYDHDKPSMMAQSYYSVGLYDPKSDEYRYSISFTPIKELLNLPIKLGEESYYMMYEKESKTERSEIHMLNLYDLIMAVSDSVLFYGTEENKEEQLDDLKKIMDDLDLDDETEGNDNDED